MVIHPIQIILYIWKVRNSDYFWYLDLPSLQSLHLDNSGLKYISHVVLTNVPSCDDLSLTEESLSYVESLTATSSHEWEIWSNRCRFAASCFDSVYSAIIRSYLRLFVAFASLRRDYNLVSPVAFLQSPILHFLLAILSVSSPIFLCGFEFILSRLFMGVIRSPFSPSTYR